MNGSVINLIVTPGLFTPMDITIDTSGFIAITVDKGTPGVQGPVGPIGPVGPQGPPGMLIGEGWVMFGQMTPKQVLVTNASTVLLDENLSRVYARINNNSSQTIFLQYGIAAVWKEGQRLSAGTTLIINAIELYLGQISAITLTGTAEIDVIEGIL